MKIGRFTITFILLGMLFLSAVLSYKNKKGKAKKSRKMRHKARNSHKARNHHKSHAKIFDASYSPTVIKDFFKKVADEKKDDKKLLDSCLEVLTENVRTEDVRKNIWTALEKFTMNPREKLTNQQLGDFLAEVKLEATNSSTPPEKVSCGDYIFKCLKDNLDNKENTDSARQMLTDAMGVYHQEVRKFNEKLITSFASYYRDSPLRHPDMFKKLNRRGI